MITDFQRIAVDSRLEFGAGFQRDPVIELGRDRADFIARRIAAEAHPTDVLTLDGWWIAAWLSWQSHATLGTSEPTPAPDGWVPRADGAEFDVLGYLAALPPGDAAPEPAVAPVRRAGSLESPVWASTSRWCRT